MTRRPLHLLMCWLLAIMALALTCAPVQAVENIEITQAHLESGEDGYKLSANFSFELNRGLEDAIMHGIPLHFTTEVELTRPRWFWFDERAITASQTIRISYNVLTRQYHVAVIGQLQQSFSTLEDALAMIRHPSRWVIAAPGSLKIGATYSVAVRLALDVDQLPKPFQVNALNNSDWRFSSDWKRFNFKAE